MKALCRTCWSCDSAEGWVNNPGSGTYVCDCHLPVCKGHDTSLCIWWL